MELEGILTRHDFFFLMFWTYTHVTIIHCYQAGIAIHNDIAYSYNNNNTTRTT